MADADQRVAAEYARTYQWECAQNGDRERAGGGADRDSHVGRVRELVTYNQTLLLRERLFGFEKVSRHRRG